MPRAKSAISRARATMSCWAAAGKVVSVSVMTSSAFTKLQCCSLKLRYCSFSAVALVKWAERPTRRTLMTEATARRNRPYAPRLSPEQRREQILDVVLEIISTEGVAAVSIDAVARRIGVTRPVVYGQFTDSNDMLRASLKREEQLALAQIMDAIPGQGDEDPASSFHHVFDAYLRGVAEAPHRWRAIFMIADSG